MEPRTLEALKASIAKWERNAEAKMPDEFLIGGDDCPLCVMFNNEDDFPGCRGCPVFEKTGRLYCNDTPYRRAVVAYIDWREFGRREGALVAAHAEVSFLKSLLPTEEAP